MLQQTAGQASKPTGPVSGGHIHLIGKQAGELVGPVADQGLLAQDDSTTAVEKKIQAEFKRSPLFVSVSVKANPLRFNPRRPIGTLGSRCELDAAALFLSEAGESWHKPCLGLDGKARVDRRFATTGLCLNDPSTSGKFYWRQR
ncbi:MAG: hypothetical protein HEQ39_19130 [Rhizobacter sp.]